jgi:hypothetical protein
VDKDSESDYTTIKYNSNGEQIWIAHYDGPANGEDKAYDMVVDRSGNIVVAGSSVGNNTNTDYAITRYDNNGNELWTERYNGPASAEDVARSVQIDSFGNIYASGWSRGDGVRYDFATIKYDADGNQLWTVRYDGPASGHDKVYAIDVDGSGNTYVTGRSSGETTYYDYTTIKYSQR